jgi:ABC-type methionine transport system ATPase subunit
MKELLRLDYPPTVVGQPLISHLVGQFNLIVNIVRAQVSQSEGWLIVEAEGSATQLSTAKAWLLEQGLDVTENPSLEDLA